MNLISTWMNSLMRSKRWVIDELKRVGCDTARSVLDLTAEELERRTDLEKETIEDVRRILKEEFEKE